MHRKPWTGRGKGGSLAASLRRGIAALSGQSGCTGGEPGARRRGRDELLDQSRGRPRPPRCLKAWSAAARA